MSRARRSRGCCRRRETVTSASTPGEVRAIDADIVRHLGWLRVERRLAARSLVLYEAAFVHLQRSAEATGVALREAQMHHVRRWAAQRHSSGLAPRSIALELSAWRGFYRWLGREGFVGANPVAGVRAPRAARPLPKALSVDHAVALVQHRPKGGDPALVARDVAIAELLYSSGLRVGELVGLDVSAADGAAGWIDAADAAAHVLGKGRRGRAVPYGLKTAEIKVRDFAKVVSRARAGDFVYFDPPYVPLTKTSNFGAFTKEGFNADDQILLRNTAMRLKARGVHVLLSNSDTPITRALYGLMMNGKKLFKVRKVQATRSINSHGDKRGRVGELIIT